MRYTAATLTDLDLSFSYIGYSGAEVRGNHCCVYITTQITLITNIHGLYV
jgi:hypothetical protein